MCFNCGGNNHISRNCTKPPCQAGKDAWNTFKTTNNNKNKQTSSKRPRNYTQVLRQSFSLSDITDPVTHIRSTRNTKRGQHDLHMASVAFLEALHGLLIVPLRTGFALPPHETSTSSSSSSSSSNSNSSNDSISLDQDLARALKDGTPANFTDPHELALYTTFRLAARTRHVYAILLSELEGCARARKLLLPTMVLHSSHGTTVKTKDIVTKKEIVTEEIMEMRVRGEEKNGEKEERCPVRVCAVGGGPGFEHVALCAVAAFMASLQVAEVVPAPIHTTLYDLYSSHWQIPMDILNEAQRKHVPQNEGSLVDTKFLDLRVGLAEQDDKGREEIREFDIFLMCYVLCENSAHILTKEHETEEITGFVRDVMHSAKSGAVMISCDASNRLWPVMTKVALACGWDVEVEPEKRVKSGSPKSCWLGVKR